MTSEERRDAERWIARKAGSRVFLDALTDEQIERILAVLDEVYRTAFKSGQR